MHPNYSVINPKLLYIDRYGNIYPDCKTYKTPVIGHITDNDVVASVKKAIFTEGEEHIFNMVTVEVSSLCHAKCFYCFQEDGRRGEKYCYFTELMELLSEINTYWLFFSGGEILDQPDAMQFIREYRRLYPKTWIHLKTNGNADLNRIEFVNECCNSIMVSFNGFTQSSCGVLMETEVSKTIAFCEAVKNYTKTNLCVKFLNSPVCISELPEFLDWAIGVRAKAIAVQTVYNYSFEGDCNSKRGDHVFEGLSDNYWETVYKRVAARTEKVLDIHSSIINTEICNLASDKKLLEIIPFSEKSKSLFRTDGVYMIE